MQLLNNCIRFLPDGPVTAFQKVNVLLGVREWLQIMRVDALLSQRAINGGIQRIAGIELRTFILANVLLLS